MNEGFQGKNKPTHSYAVAGFKLFCINVLFYEADDTWSLFCSTVITGILEP